MAHHTTLAPWAEEAPGAPFPLTVDDLLALPDDADWQYELVDGRLVRMPGSGWEASRIAARLIIALGAFVEQRNLGAVTGADGAYNVTAPGATLQTGLVPDVAFVAAARMPTSSSPEYRKAPRLAPDLVAEVVSPSQHHPEMSAKAQLYLAAGVRLVWLVWPRQQQVEVWRPGSAVPVSTLVHSDALDGLELVPGFTLPLSRLFAP
ncbi:MAG TPA: Uma2 family endonuclease [Ktedonobacterales bacterium]|nr:Uma2 family endonuclease [Ktedonobacterales bacterium]